MGIVRHGCVIRDVPRADRGRPEQFPLGAIGVVGWLFAMALALLNLVLGGLALASDGRAARGAVAIALAVFAAGVTVSVLLVSAIPNRN